MYIVKAGCPGCGSCQNVCPVGAITQDGIGVKIDDKCVDCGFCVHSCPVRLIEPGPVPAQVESVPQESRQTRQVKKPERSDE